MIGGIMKRFGVLLLAICRTVYCWMFLIGSLGAADGVSIGVRRMAQTHLVDKGTFGADIIFTIYSIVFGIAWWMVLRGKPALTRWAIAANLIFIFFYIPGLLGGDWRGILRVELEAWPVLLFGFFGIIIFSIPYHGWRYRSAVGEPLRSQ
jgi:hypothetical protein